MNTPAIHPTPEQLAAYRQGQLADDDEQRIESHLSDCETCCEALDSLPEDTLQRMLRNDDTPAVDQPAAGGSPVDVAAALADHPRYALKELIGRGGMGAVYRAEHRRMHREVALKVINPELTQRAAAVERFGREVRAAAQLKHEHIVTAYDADHVGDLHFLVLEFVDGTNLADLVAEKGRLPVDEACRHARQAALGLQHAWDQGMVHRDIKPHNLMLTNDGVVKILDFGLANWVTETTEPTEEPDTTSGTDGRLADEPLTRHGALLGSLDYLAPEQAANPHGADVRADIYALGATLYFLLTGRPPYAEATGMDKLKAHEQGQPADLRGLRDDLPPELAEVVRRMMAKDPADRFQTPAEVADALAPFVDRHRTRPPVRQPAQTPPAKPVAAGAPHPPVGPSKASVGIGCWLLIVLGSLVAVGITVVALAAWFYARVEVEPREDVDKIAVTQPLPSQDPPVQDVERSYELIGANGVLAELVPETLPAVQGLPQTLATAGQLLAVGTSAGNVYLDVATSGQEAEVAPASRRTSIRLDNGPCWPALSARGDRMVTCDGNGMIQFWAVQGAEAPSPDDGAPIVTEDVSRQWQIGNNVVRFRADPLFRWGVSIDQWGDAQLWDLDAATEAGARRLLAETALWDAQFVEDQPRLITLGRDGTLHAWDLPRRTPTPLARVDEGQRMAVSRSGAVAVLTSTGDVHVLNPSGQIRFDIWPGLKATQVRFSGDERMLYVTTPRGLTIYDAHQGRSLGNIYDTRAFEMLGQGPDGVLVSASQQPGSPLLLWYGLEEEVGR